MVGYTTLSEQMDPEDVAALMNQLFEALTAEIVRFGGTVDKYSGDAVMALFGAPRALENHEEMAVRAALAMQQAILDFRFWILDSKSENLKSKITIRIGLHTGEVLAGLLGGLGTKSYTVMGDTVNLASRLEGACPPGRVMASAATARPLHAIFDFEPPRQITVKGKSEPVTVYLVAKEKAQRGRVRGLAGLHAPMVGRERELATLQATLRRVVEERSWQVAAVVGEAGIGKTRLRREFVAWATQTYSQLRLLTARSYVHTQTTPYALVAGLVRALFNVAEEADAAAAAGALAGGLRSLNPNLEETEFGYRFGSLAGVLGLPLPDDPLQGLEPEQRRDRTLLSLERVLAAAAVAPLLMVIEDLHWTDDLSRALLERLIRLTGDPAGREGAAMLFIVSRPPEEAQSPVAHILGQLSGQNGDSPLLRLAPLAAAEAERLVAALLGQSLPADLLGLIVDNAQGIPFFVEEILRALTEEGTLARDPASGRWQVTQATSRIQVPATVQDLLAARLDRLPAAEKRLVQHAAVIGRTFWQQLLAEVMGGDGPGAGDVEAALARLEARQLIGRIGQSQIADDWEWVFAHVLIQEAAYASVLKSARRRIHGQVAAWLEARLDPVGDSSPLLPLVAYHYTQAEAPAKAALYLGKAGRQAAAQFANNEAIRYFSRALKLLDQADVGPAEKRAWQHEWLMGREEVYGLLGQRDYQVADLAHLRALAREMNDAGRQAEVALRYAVYYEAISDFPAALEAAGEVVRWAEAAGDPQGKSEGLIAWGRALWRQGRFEEARQQLEQALALARQQGYRPGEATSLHHLGTVFYYLGHHYRAQEYLEQALAIRRSLGDRGGEAVTLTNLLSVYHGLGDLSKARVYGQKALAIDQVIGNRRGEALTLNNLGAVYHALGDLLTARDYHQRAMTLFANLGDRGGESLAANNLGLVLHDLGDNLTARHYCAQALAIDREIGDQEGEGYSLTSLGLVLEGLEEIELAAGAYERALRLRRETGQGACAVDDLAGLARTALKRGKVTEALAYVEETLSWIATHGVEGIEYPLRVYLACADVLSVEGDPERVLDVLTNANALIRRQAQKIEDESTRRTFLEEVSLHRQLQERLRQYEAASTSHTETA
ncbi:MAG: tetratricopeptide repeat protein [Chloroflexi bacterium]|nr:tetratricopeptide repeat protein [Chloroflexota bacterium]MCI0579795.1 tetratricopeptide repeat protein [Chloroflexota bacterium]MCI0648607.1 tetratricopeptide repeat protein [Chloroflexota bacterium]